MFDRSAGEIILTLVEATPSSLYKGHRFPAEIISHCVWLYHRFPLSLRDVEQMMAGACLRGFGRGQRVIPVCPSE